MKKILVATAVLVFGIAFLATTSDSENVGYGYGYVSVMAHEDGLGESESLSPQDSGIGFHDCCDDFAVVDGKVVGLCHVIELVNAGEETRVVGYGEDSSFLVGFEACCTDYDECEQCEHMEFDPHSTTWPWTDCSNMFGHSWGAWTDWMQDGAPEHDRFCTALHPASGAWCWLNIYRFRTCQRANCNARDSEQSRVVIHCRMWE